MEQDSIRDLVTVEDDQGNLLSYEVEALFEMQGESYALLRSNEETVLMRVEEDGKEQYLVGLSDKDDKDAILDAYQVAVDAAPAE
ncbi:DUF1292 domain-containing protein [Mesobacillus foraminis]|jgi:hypothetical protein|uniref:Uncharacterized protein DUF1292 n=1 Tax=Mesobacillus foraminis TaxID=279826 RepID=A0A4R2BHU4_9BACI|nr:DUF1292 domain-containing protein [Mesobacillus foraminis]TCN25992.1 uncharacterized protein DUF1292 [Mesobacillus foraminis]